MVDAYKEKPGNAGAGFVKNGNMSPETIYQPEQPSIPSPEYVDIYLTNAYMHRALAEIRKK
ncbi:MAG: hypothetical protein APR53_00150 [Methanoculleus sp. SDB]|nr:MAG: hypothetical protein APR53_00150 [Methanoculleus sp. SDB]